MRKGETIYTPEELETLSQLYPTMPLKDIAERMGKTYNSLLWQKHKLGLRKPFSQLHELKPVTNTPTELAYLAGLIDGEGTVSIRKFSKKWKPHIRVAGCSTVLMDWLSATFTGPSIFIEHRKIHEGRMQAHMFHIPGISYVLLYEALLPFMVIKREQMALLAEYSHTRLAQNKMDQLTPRQMEMVERIKQLNIKPYARFLAEQ